MLKPYALLFFCSTVFGFCQPMPSSVANILVQRELGGILVEASVGGHFKSGNYLFALYKKSLDGPSSLVVARSFAGRYAIIWEYSQSNDTLSAEFASNLALTDLNNDGYPESSWNMTAIGKWGGWADFFLLDTKSLQLFQVKVSVGQNLIGHLVSSVSLDPSLQREQNLTFRKYLESLVEKSGTALDGRTQVSIRLEEWVVRYGINNTDFGIFVLSKPFSLPLQNCTPGQYEPKGPQVVFQGKIYRGSWRSSLLRVDQKAGTCELLIVIYRNYQNISKISVSANLLVLEFEDNKEVLRFDPIKLMIR